MHELTPWLLGTSMFNLQYVMILNRKSATNIIYYTQNDQFVVNDLYYVFGLDQIVTSHPIIVDVNRPEEISEVFDGISYSKVSFSSW